MRRQRPLDVKLWLRKSPPSCAQSTKAACLPVNVCLLRSSIMIRAAPWEVLGTSADRSARAREQWLRAYLQATAVQAATLAPRPPFHARVETLTTKLSVNNV